MAHEIVVARRGEIAPGETKKFLIPWQGREEEGFVVNHHGQFYAYLNRCCHVPMTMDWVDNRFLTPDKRYIQCATHGACYLPDTGECIHGPALGEFLVALPLTIRGETILVSGDE